MNRATRRRRAHSAEHAAESNRSTVGPYEYAARCVFNFDTASECLGLQYAADSAGRACASCDACRLRRDGFSAAGLSDPTRYRQTR